MDDHGLVFARRIGRRLRQEEFGERGLGATIGAPERSIQRILTTGVDRPDRRPGPEPADPPTR